MNSRLSIGNHDIIFSNNGDLYVNTDYVPHSVYIYNGTFLKSIVNSGIMKLYMNDNLIATITTPVLNTDLISITTLKPVFISNFYFHDDLTHLSIVDYQTDTLVMDELYPEGYIGGDCEEWQCYGVDSNDPNVCSGNGLCTAPDTCVCDAGYIGSDCDVMTCGGIDFNDPSVCGGNGVCIGPNHCDCMPTTGGEECIDTKDPTNWKQSQTLYIV